MIFLSYYVGHDRTIQVRVDDCSPSERESLRMLFRELDRIRAIRNNPEVVAILSGGLILITAVIVTPLLGDHSYFFTWFMSSAVVAVIFGTIGYRMIARATAHHTAALWESIGALCGAHDRCREAMRAVLIERPGWCPEPQFMSTQIESVL